jgi:hypothetical protein
MRGWRVSLGLVFLSSVAGPVLAHHSAAMFDVTQERVIQGIVTDFAWKNPHSYLTIRTNDANRIDQVIEVGPPATLRPLGLKEDAVRVGDAVSVRVNPAKRGKIVLGRELTKADGSTWPLMLSPFSRRPEPVQSAPSIAGTWVSQGFFSMARGISGWPFTEKGRAHIAAQDPLQTSHTRCIPVTAPMLMLYPVTNQIELEDDVLRMRIDWMGSERIVYMDGRSHPEEDERSLHGHSIGHWDGKTLVIDTTQFADHSDGNFMTVPSGGGKHLVERIALTEDGRHLKYDVELSDPEWFTAPVMHSALFDYQPELAPSGLPCDPEAASRFLAEP